MIWHIDYWNCINDGHRSFWRLKTSWHWLFILCTHSWREALCWWERCPEHVAPRNATCLQTWHERWQTMFCWHKLSITGRSRCLVSAGLWSPKGKRSLTTKLQVVINDMQSMLSISASETLFEVLQMHTGQVSQAYSRIGTAVVRKKSIFLASVKCLSHEIHTWNSTSNVTDLFYWLW